MKKIILVWCIFFVWGQVEARPADWKGAFQNPPEEAAPWIFWYWMYGAVSKEGITADLEAMKRIGLGGAYLMPIKDPSVQQLYTPSVQQLSPEWWEMVRFAFAEADRLGLQLGLHICDGFALAGGPWITPRLAMQKVVYTDTLVSGEMVSAASSSLALPRPEAYQGYYRDIAVFALPVKGEAVSASLLPKVTSDTEDAAPVYLAIDTANGTFRSSEPCWIQYEFDQPFTCRSLTVVPGGNNFQAQRLQVAASEDGVHFHTVKQLVPFRHGWQNTDADFTFSIPETTARYYRFYWTPAGTEPGAEDLDAAKWKPNLKIKKIRLQEAARIENYEGKSGQVWRLSGRVPGTEIPDSVCVQPEEIIELTAYLQPDGTLKGVLLPQGRWRILRIGHTATGHTNATGGGAKGLECDKFNPEAIRIQYKNWFGAAFRQTDSVMARRVLKRMHVDSWECGSQNWSDDFAMEFHRRRGYSLYPYLPLYAGIPLKNIETSEQVLHDIRQTIAELVPDVFYRTLADLAQEAGCELSAECVAPTMMSDGLVHYQYADRPMGEFWLRSPTHDKPNDMLDAISGAHIYGKQIVQAEGFTQLRTMWDEHPGMLKILGDRNFALGINKLFFHVYAHQPFTDRKPGMTLDGIGLCMQRDQTWWDMSRAWIDYIRRCQTLLQRGKPVTDIAVFIGEETPRRAVLPDRLVPSLPGIFGAERIAAEKERLANTGQPMRIRPVGVTHTANMADPENWIDPLRGYAYDSFNKDVLLKARVENGQMVLPGGAAYRIVVFPLPHPMAPDSNRMSVEVAYKIKELQDGGVKILLPGWQPDQVPGFLSNAVFSQDLQQLVKTIWARLPEDSRLPYTQESFAGLGVERDVQFRESDGKEAGNVAWNHRRDSACDIYFIANQEEKPRNLTVFLRETGRVPEWWNPVTGEITTPEEWSIESGKTRVKIRLDKAGSGFIVLKELTKESGSRREVEQTSEPLKTAGWKVTFEENGTSVERDSLFDWSEDPEASVRYYSGVACYQTTFTGKALRKKERKFLDLGQVGVIAEVKVNGISCGTAWTAPCRVEITQAWKKGKNQLEIRVANTWANRIKGAQEGKVSAEGIWTNAPYRLEKEKLNKSGLLGPLQIIAEKER